MKAVTMTVDGKVAEMTAVVKAVNVCIVQAVMFTVAGKSLTMTVVVKAVTLTVFVKTVIIAVAVTLNVVVKFNMETLKEIFRAITDPNWPRLGHHECAR